MTIDSDIDYNDLIRSERFLHMSRQLDCRNMGKIVCGLYDHNGY